MKLPEIYECVSRDKKCLFFGKSCMCNGLTLGLKCCNLQCYSILFHSMSYLIHVKQWLDQCRMKVKTKWYIYIKHVFFIPLFNMANIFTKMSDKFHVLIQEVPLVSLSFFGSLSESKIWINHHLTEISDKRILHFDWPKNVRAIKKLFQLVLLGSRCI